MVDRWTVERAVRQSNLDPPGRLLILTLLTWADHATATIPEPYTPSLTTLTEATGLARSTIKDWLNFLETVGWVGRQRPDPQAARARKARTRYSLHVPPRRSWELRRPADLIGGQPADRESTGGGDMREHSSGDDGSEHLDPTVPDDPPGASDPPGSAGSPSSPAAPDIPDMTRPPGGPAQSDMPDFTGPADGTPDDATWPPGGLAISGIPDMIGPPGGLKPEQEKTNRTRARQQRAGVPRPGAHRNPPPLPSTPVGEPAVPIDGHRYVEGPNGYCTVDDCGRSAPMHAPVAQVRRRTTPLQWRRDQDDERSTLP